MLKRTLNMKNNSVLDASKQIADDTSVISIVSFGQFVQTNGPLSIRRLEEHPRNWRTSVLVPSNVRSWVPCKMFYDVVKMVTGYFCAGIKTTFKLLG